MKRTLMVLAVVLLVAGGVFAQELTISGEVKTGMYMEQEQIGSGVPLVKEGMTNSDGDSGSGQGRLRMDFRFVYGNLGLRFRFQIQPTVGAQGPFQPLWSFAYAYGNLFNEQLTVSAGLLGESPWGSGGTWLRSEPETREYIGYNELSGEPYTVNEGLFGIRVEYKPSFVPGLNIGFVLNQPDQTPNAQNRTFGDILGESVIGAAYEHEYFAVRLGYRFDGNADMYLGVNEGGRLAYRVEERVLDTLIPGMQVWLNGAYYGIGGELGDTSIPNRKLGRGEYLINWLYWLWDADNFIAQFDVCFAAYQSYFNSDKILAPMRQEYQSLEFLPAFYYKLFDNLLQAGLRLGLGMEFGPGKTYSDSSYQYISVEPQIKLNLGGTAYIAAVYNYTNKYAWFNETQMQRRGEMSVKHSLNIRAVYTF